MRFAFVLFILLFPVSAFAADIDEGLYDPLPPQGSAFVRFVNLEEGDHQEKTQAKGKSFGTIGANQATPYYVVSEGEAELQMGKKKDRQKLESSALYTFVSAATSESPVVLRDPVSGNRSKALISFYNLSKGPLSLKTTDKEIEVIGNVSSGEVKMREANPVKITLAIYQGDTQKRALEPIILERGQSYSVFYAGDEALVVQGQTDTTR